MNHERLTEEYLNTKALVDDATKRLTDMKRLLQAAVEINGLPDEKGHLRFQAGKWALQVQRRQGAPRFDRDAAEQWLLEMTSEEQEQVTSVKLDEDKLAAWVYENRSDQVIHDRYASLFVTPEPTFAFMPPTENLYNDY